MLQIQNVSKKFKLYHSPADRLKEIVTGKQFHREFLALDNISFQLASGETLGIIGQNGAGKSTLLKILSGIIIPDKGNIISEGKITGLLELGTGFNYDMTGLENIYMNGTLIGMSRNEIDAKKQQIIDFSEIGDFIAEPLKTYSSGMVMRLAFSIAIHADPSCFLVDEALSVGDAYFQQKCIQKIQQFKEQGGSILFVSHDINMIATICDSAILIDKGKVMTYGKPEEVIDLYISLISQKAHQGQEEVVIGTGRPGKGGQNTSISTREIEFITRDIRDPSGLIVNRIVSEDEVIISFSFRSNRLIEKPVYGILLRNRYGASVFGTNTYLQEQNMPPLYPGKEYNVSFRFRVSLQPDDYLITFAIDAGGFGQNSFEEYLLRLNNIATLKVVRNEITSSYEGITDLHPVIVVKPSEFSSQET